MGPKFAASATFEIGSPRIFRVMRSAIAENQAMFSATCTIFVFLHLRLVLQEFLSYEVSDGGKSSYVYVLPASKHGL